MRWSLNTEKEVYDFLDSRNKFGSKPGLFNMEHLMAALGHPEDKVPTIHIAGTNGKGSLGAFLTGIYRQDRLIAYHFSSPAVFHANDVWKRNGLSVKGYELVKCGTELYDVVRRMDYFELNPTRFEVETAFAIYGSNLYYNNVLILEAGMGGAEDATNIINWPKICAFTNISYDHMQYLGESLTEIATAKAGIIKPGCKVFSAEQDPEVKAVLDEKMVYGKVTYVDNNDLELISQKPGELKFRYKGEEYETSMSGLYQMKNAALAIEIARDLKFSEETIKAGIKLAFWDGRFEVLSENPYFIIDGAHNVDAIKQLAETIENCFTNQPIDFIIGVLKDKEHEKMMEIMMPYANRIYTITPPNERGLDAKILAEEIKQWHEDVVCCGSIESAVRMAMDHGRETGCPILAFGSLSYLGKVKECHDIYLKSRN